MPQTQTPEHTTDLCAIASGNLSFLLSVVRCGEQLSPEEEAVIRRTIAALGTVRAVPRA
ncbi:MAG TPA: hypothetical protein VFP27_06200 [Mycobacterium sp.]|nr:hypothetical protein [Mycobacterium sp.]